MSAPVAWERPLSFRAAGRALRRIPGAAWTRILLFTVALAAVQVAPLLVQRVAGGNAALLIAASVLSLAGYVATLVLGLLIVREAHAGITGIPRAPLGREALQRYLGAVAIVGAVGVALGAGLGFVTFVMVLGEARTSAYFIAALLGLVAFALVVWAAISLLVLAPVALLERRSVQDTLARSFDMMRGRRGAAFVLALPVMVPFAAALVALALLDARVPATPAFLLGAALTGLALGAAGVFQALVYARLASWTPPTPRAAAGEDIVVVRDLKKYFPIRGGLIQRTMNHVRAVDGISFSIKKGRTLGLVGESGCGKTTVGRVLLRLTNPTSGSVLFQGHDVARVPRAHLRALRPQMQIVFQDPMSSLNPRMTVRQILLEPLLLNGWPREAADEKVTSLLEKVGLRPEHQHRFPHEFSGGQRQRIGVARALALDPAFIVLDEPTSALDVSVQAQVLNLLKHLQRDLGLTYLFISHDLSVVRHLCDEVAVMYLGRIVEQGPVEQVFSDPQHPYTQALLSAVPIPDPELRAKRILLTGDVPSPVNPPKACRFNPRCPRAQDVCREVDPPLEPKKPLQLAACHFPGDPAKWPVTQPAKAKVADA